MARRARGGAPEVSLFPFLSILACVIGTLTLMITALALGQMDTPEVESAENYSSSKRRLDKNNEAVARLTKEIENTLADAEKKNTDLAALRREIERLEQELGQLQQQPAPQGEIPQVDVKAHQARLAELQKEIKSLETRIAALEQQIDQRKIPPAAVVRIQPGGSGVDLTPTFVECAATRIVIYGGDEPRPVRRADLRTDAAFLELLDRIADSEKQTVVFLVRDDAVGTYMAARNVAIEKYARNGKLPVIGQGKIDLSLFKKQS
jgi:polyhydroxyalkanoate synthesis regulator phasin